MVGYNIKNSSELASYINYTNLNNMITEGEMREFLEKYGYSNDEIDLIFCQMCVVTISSRNLTKML